MTAALSNEIWLLVLDYLDRKDLRCTCLAGQSLASLAAPALFRTLVMRPNIDSLNRAWAIAEVPAFAQAVKALELHAETVFVTGREAAAFMKKFHFLDFHPIYGSTDYAKIDYHKFYTNRPELSRSELKYKNRNEGAELDCLFHHFPVLESVERYFDQNRYDWNARSTFGERYGVKPTIPNFAFSFDNVISAIKGSKVHTVLMHHLRWWQFKGPWADICLSTEGLAQIKTLDLSFRVHAGGQNNPDRGLVHFHHV